ncbi:uncharacterized protein LOC125633483 [Caretta caretta]|uniref:uncharacterized protein LOC125633483 n=1 Tax=Caretta caretta TaxID=8467 RepID=UPI003F4C4F2E
MCRRGAICGFPLMIFFQKTLFSRSLGFCSTFATVHSQSPWYLDSKLKPSSEPCNDANFLFEENCLPGLAFSTALDSVLNEILK